MMEIEKRLTELEQQVRLLHEQMSGLQQKVIFIELLLLFLLVASVGVFLWRKIREYQAIKGSTYSRAQVRSSNDMS